MLIKKHSYMKQNLNDLPRGMRNNNPLNIRRYCHNDWLGKITDSVATDMEFEEFRAPRYGFRASFILVHRYIKQGYKCVRDIISRWAPACDNNYTQSYIDFVCRFMQCGPDTEIKCYDFTAMSNLFRAMFEVENGVSWHKLPDRLYWETELSEGYDLYVERFVQ